MPNLIRPGADLSRSADLNLTHLVEAIQQATSQYFRLVIVAGPSKSGKTGALHVIQERFGYPLLNVNLELSKRMLELTRGQRSRQVESLLKELIAAAPGEVVLLDNLEILFDTGLEVEPLRMLQVSSRNRTIVASWNGTFIGGTLTYAEPGHPEFVQFKKIDAIVIPVGKSADQLKELSSS
jgi:hypothetical protein